MVSSRGDSVLFAAIKVRTLSTVPVDTPDAVSNVSAGEFEVKLQLQPGPENRICITPVWAPAPTKVLNGYDAPVARHLCCPLA